MSADRISYDTKGRFFEIDGQYGYNGSVSVHDGIAYVQEPLESSAKYNKLTAKVIGQVVATALMEGATKIQFQTVALSVNYLVQMLGFTGKHGWFTDVLSSTQDHAFDPNHPTPGFFIGEARKLQDEAAELEKYARLARSAYRFDEASESEARATELRATVRRLLTQL
jgi:type III secretory pathway component EscS